MSALGQKWTSGKLSLPRELSPSPQHNGLAQITLPYRAAIKLNDHAVGRINRASLQFSTQMRLVGENQSSQARDEPAWPRTFKSHPFWVT